MLFFRLENERLHIVGQVDATTIDAFEARITEVIGSGPVILDMTGVDFIDSGGLRVLLTMSQRPGAPRPLRIVPSEAVRTIFGVAGLDALPEVEFLLPPR
jgi:anti-anti-sigma factor